MKELKFRAWNKRDKKMECLDYLNVSKAQFCGEFRLTPPDGLFGVATVKGNMLKMDEVDILQYTGLKDKNDTEIYEGDILRAILNGRETIEWVGFEKGAFTISEYKDRHWTVPMCQYNQVMDIFEIIGNAYENSDLLKDEK